MIERDFASISMKPSTTYCAALRAASLCSSAGSALSPFSTQSAPNRSAALGRNQRGCCRTQRNGCATGFASVLLGRGKTLAEPVAPSALSPFSTESPPKRRARQRSLGPQPKRVLPHSAQWVCHWLCQCPLGSRKNTGRASGTQYSRRRRLRCVSKCQ
jgi:hypothetical protein